MSYIWEWTGTDTYRPRIYCHKCGQIEVEKEGDLCAGCAGDAGGGNSDESTKEK